MALSDPETVLTYGAPGLKFGPGSSDEIGFDLSQYDVRRALVVTDAGVAATGHPHRVAELMRDVGIPNGIGAVGYGDCDIADLVEGSLQQQQRLLATAPRVVTAEDLAGIRTRSLELW